MGGVGSWRTLIVPRPPNPNHQQTQILPCLFCGIKVRFLSMTVATRTRRNVSSKKIRVRRRLYWFAGVISVFNCQLIIILLSSTWKGQETSPPGDENDVLSVVGTTATNNTAGRINDQSYPIVSSYDNGMSACLLVMDDNHFLIEWIAFHYHTLPLRYLVVAVDPRSKTSPASIFRRWRNNMNLTIVQWEDKEFMSSVEQQEAEKHVQDYFGGSNNKNNQNNKIGRDLIRHRARQRLFYYKCMVHLKTQQRDWALLTDTDEFLYLNYPTIEKMGRPNVPPMTQPGSVLTFLKAELHQPFHNLTSPCVQIPRIRFGAMESKPNEIRANIPSVSLSSSLSSLLLFEPEQFLTMRWRTHANPHDYGYNRISKVLIDLSRVPWEELKPVDSIHRPIRSMCGHRRLHIRKPQQVLVINHYLGTLEQYTFRDDSREGNERSIVVCWKNFSCCQKSKDQQQSGKCVSRYSTK